MLLGEKAQEILETLWLQMEGEAPVPLAALQQSPGFDELSQFGYVSVSDDHVGLTERGKREAEAAIRRHRLAERLLADVLDLSETSLDEASCQFEHALHAGIEDKVCRLLGHPRVCPHGKPIPRGACCGETAKGGDRLVSPLGDLPVGSEGCVAYISTHDSARMNELIAIGVVPGVSVKLLRNSPSYVFRLGESEFAVDREMAKAICVRVHR
jgi:DtxR family transcriptional regulator, Mn-dependent transcriptional regulator